MTIVLGAIADDFTGATDLANNLVRGGMRCVQTIGIPDAPLSPQETEALENVDAIVVALKSRACPAAEAVADSLAALDWLQARGADLARHARHFRGEVVELVCDREQGRGR